MSARTIRISEDGRTWEFAGRRRRTNDAGDPVAHVQDLTRCTATDLKAALARSRDWYGYGDQLLVSEGNPDGDVEEGFVGPVSFRLQDDSLLMELSYATSAYIDDEAELHEHVKQIMAPLLDRNRMWMASAENNESVVVEPWIVEVGIGFHNRGRQLGDLVAVGLDAIALLEAVDTGSFGREQVADMLRGGHADALVGQPEGEWLEAKRQHYDFASIGGKIALAQSVARFANAERGGLVVVGLETKSVVGQDVIRAVRPMPHDARIVRRYEHVLQERLYPPPDSLRIERIEHPHGDLVLIDVPPQPEDLKPFLVHGAIVDGRVEGAFISIVRRRGDGSIPTTAPMIHASLVAGRALLRRGQLPE